jgi:hypothetical protein
MTVTADGKRRVVLPPAAKPGDLFDLEISGEGKFVLTRLVKLVAEVRLVRERGYLVAESDRPITLEQTREALDQYP